MAKIGIGESTFKAGDDEYTLRFDICVMMELEGAFDASIEDVLKTLGTGQTRHVVRIFQEMLKGGGHDVSLRDAAYLLAENTDGAGEAVKQAMERAAIDTDNGGKPKRPAKKS